MPVVVCPNNKCTDFPAMPIIDEGTPADPAGMFPGAPSGAGPCLIEPEDGSLFPRAWLRPRIKWSGTTGLHRITIHADKEDKDLVVYTTKSSWAIPKDIWRALGGNVVEQDITVTVRAAAGGESAVKFQIAPVNASGSLVFWAAKPDSVGKPETMAADDDTELRGFSVGDETTVSVLRISQVAQPSSNESGTRRKVTCIGCHVATPDPGFVAFVDNWPWNLAIGGVRSGSAGSQLPGLTPGGLAALNLPWGGMMAFSKPHWAPGRRLVMLASSLQDYLRPYTTDNARPGKLVWYNLDSPAPEISPMTNTAVFIPGTHYGEVARMGDTRGAAAPAWSRDGNTIVYCSTAGGNLDGGLAQGSTDLYQVPFNNGAGGPATPLAGAAQSTVEEYYPAFSPDDSLVVYNSVPTGQSMYANKNAELYVVPAKQAGAAVRMAANDPPACSGKKSPGISNSWGRWAPNTISIGDRRFYWVLFSSNRSDIPPVPRKFGTGDPLIPVSQLYVTAVVATGQPPQLKTYPAIYLWNQPTTTINATPIWEDLEIPTVQ